MYHFCSISARAILNLDIQWISQFCSIFVLARRQSCVYPDCAGKNQAIWQWTTGKNWCTLSVSMTAVEGERLTKGRLRRKSVVLHVLSFIICE